MKYIGIKPKLILEKLKKDVMRDAGERIEILSKVKQTDEFTQLENLYTGGIVPAKRENISASLKGKVNISNQIKETLQNAESEIIICTSVEDLTSKLKIFSQTFQRLKNSKIKIKVALTGDEKIINELSKKLAIKFKKININAKFFIVDRKEVLFYVTKNAEEDIAIWLDSDFFAQAFADLFNKAIEG